MKASKVFIRWIVISLILQCSLYLFLDKIYFSDEHNIKITKIQDIIKKKTLKPNVTFPQGYSDVSLSYDGSYTTYFDNSGDLKVLDTGTGNFKSIKFRGAKCISYKWLPDANKIMLAEKLTVGNSRYIKFFTYDAGKETKEEIRDYSLDIANAIKLVDEKTKVDIQVSTLTGLMYLKTYSNKITSSVYRIDINEEMTKIQTHGRSISRMAVASHDDHLAYEDLTNNFIRTNTKEGIIKINGSTNLLLLGADGKDNIYVGKNENGNVSNLHYGKLSDNKSSWKQLNLKENVSPNKLIILKSGDVYTISDNSIIRVSDNKKIDFKGEFIGIYTNYLASISNGKLVFVEIKPSP
ncbi:hypothetical protein [Clostridium tagluense]|uniref:hypothetical protein n=1 Tax=Clostridium tagluense TaxID=360422 RepID=UPI001C6E2D6A|nr:hypothetical protein [Clostridium tagluense]MBW9157260.1 hypothetical protein [Clostridium tagluense]WLC67564.1 hypothetical protein KTC93_10515 [Clostridium tagluense]